MNLWKTAVLLVFIVLYSGCSVAHHSISSEPKGKVAVCHKGKKTVYVAEPAVKAHLGHGDYVGICP